MTFYVRIALYRHFPYHCHFIITLTFTVQILFSQHSCCVSWKHYVTMVTERLLVVLSCWVCYLSYNLSVYYTLCIIVHCFLFLYCSFMVNWCFENFSGIWDTLYLQNGINVSGLFLQTNRIVFLKTKINNIHAQILYYHAWLSTNHVNILFNYWYYHKATNIEAENVFTVLLCILFRFYS